MPDLELHGFTYADLHQPAALPKLDALFLEYLDDRDCTLAERFKAYRAGEKLEHVAESELLIAAARHLEDFLVRAFGAAHARDALRTAQIQDEPVHAFKERFAKQRARRKRAIPARPFAQLDALIGRAIGSDAATDRELAVARLWEKAERENDAALLALLEEWVWAACNTAEGKTATTGWCSLSFPNKLDYFRLVPAHALQGDAAGRVTGSPERQRRRDGFNLTDPRCDLREAMDQVHYCVYCHTHDGDFCSKGFPDKDSGAFRINPLGVDLTGCPLEEKISQAHVLKLEGYTLGALAVIMIDNPLLPATGHRICNDCMKSCIYQKQEPVNIPQIETRILTDVLGWPWGFEIYFLLTRWNPLNRERPYALPYNGVKVLCAGAGPAGFTLSYHLLQAGFGVVAIDGLKIEPLPPRWVGTPDRPPQPIQDVRELHEPMDERVMTGFGGVAEYGITARWDKNFLRLIYITLARYPTFRIYGGVRIGGTLTLEDAWDRGFDHVALATGAGKPTVIPMKNNLAQGIRQASDFLMALQLTGAAKKDSLANLQVRLPALVIGGGLTAIDTATEVQVYYVRQVEKILERHETLSATRDVEATLNPIEQGILCEYLAHGREIGKERARAAAAGEAPNFTPLLRAWGGVTVVYRRALHESPAYVRNHEEIEKALQEGIYYAQGLAPVEAKLDEHGHVSAVVFNKQVRDDAGRWHDGDAAVELAARSVFIAAGSVPNTVYEREHPGTFKMDGQYFATHAADANDPSLLRQIDAQGGCKSDTIGFMTSYRHGRCTVSFHGDTHPLFHGSVVKAMASGKRGAREIIALFQERLNDQAQPASLREIEWRDFLAQLDDDLRPRIVGVEHLGPKLTRLTIRAPQAARNWRPGQVYRLQNYEHNAFRAGNTRLQMEGIAIDGTQVDAQRGEIKLLLNKVGASTRIASMLSPGERIVLMGPSGTGTPMPENQTITVLGNHSAVTSAMDGATAWRNLGNRIIFIGHFKNREQALHIQPLMEQIADQIIWVFDTGPHLVCTRPRDRSFNAGLGEFLRVCSDGAAYAGWLADSDHLLVSDHPSAMQELADALRTSLNHRLKPGLVATAAVNSPMQCMMKEVCAQCLCRHHDRATGNIKRVVFSCFNHHQPLFDVDFANLRLRQGQNSLQEKLSSAWLSYLLENGAHPALQAGRVRRA